MSLSSRPFSDSSSKVAGIKINIIYKPMRIVPFKYLFVVKVSGKYLISAARSIPIANGATIDI